MHYLLIDGAAVVRDVGDAQRQSQPPEVVGDLPPALLCHLIAHHAKQLKLRGRAICEDAALRIEIWDDRPNEI